MALTLARISSFLRDTVVGGDQSEGATTLFVVNQAGRIMYGLHPWSFALGDQVDLEFRQSVPSTAAVGSSITGATWDESTLTLTSSAAFTNYEQRAGDQIEILAGTSTTTGKYGIASKVSGNAITLESSLQTPAAGSASAIEFRITNSYASLPSDFGEIVHVELRNSLTRRVRRSTLAEIAARRSNGVNIDDFTFWTALSYNYPGTPAQGTPRLELYPAPLVNDPKALRLIYRRKWQEVENDNEELRLPDWAEPLFMEVVRAVALGYEEGDIATVDDRLDRIRVGGIYKACVRTDARQNPIMGPSIGGHTKRVYFGNQTQSRQSVTSPS